MVQSSPLQQALIRLKCCCISWMFLQICLLCILAFIIDRHITIPGNLNFLEKLARKGLEYYRTGPLLRLFFFSFRLDKIEQWSLFVVDFTQESRCCVHTLAYEKGLQKHRHCFQWEKTWSKSKGGPHVFETLSVFSQSLSNLKKKITNYFLSEHMGVFIIKSDTKTIYRPMRELGMAKVVIIVIFFKAALNNLPYDF